jgi:hypothetical protein
MPRHIVGLMPRFISWELILSAGLIGLTGCGGYGPSSQPPPTPTSVTISPMSASVKVGGMQTFTATVMNDYLNRGVTWALSAGCSGANCGGSLTSMTSSSVTYNAPATVPSPATVTLTATSVNDTSKSSTATITVTAAAAAGVAAVSVTIGPQLDPSAVFRTHVPHLSSTVGQGGTARVGAAQPATSATFSGQSYAVGPTVAPTTTIPEAEEHIAVNPNNSSNLVAAISDFSLRGGFNTTKFAFSFNNGAAGSWRENFVPLVNGSPATGDGNVWQANSDPVLAIDRFGHVYLVDLYINVLGSGNTVDGLYVSIGSVSGSSVNFTVAQTFSVVPPVFTPNDFQDKPWIAVDNSSNASTTGNVYVSWTRFVNGTDKIIFSRSVNQGARWSTPVQINPKSQNGAVQGSQVAVGPAGEIYVTYEVFFMGGLRQHFLAKSTDGGQSFTAPVAITPLFNDLSFSSSYRKNSFPALAVSPADGNVYEVYADQLNASVGAEVEFILSTNGGASFSSPVVINDDSSGEQFMPAVTVDSSGAIHASWFDTRRSPTNASMYDIFATFSKDAGGTFAPNAQVTSTLVDADSVSFIGDYAGIAAAGGFAHPVWTSGGFNNGLLQTATLTLPKAP